MASPCQANRLLGEVSGNAVGPGERQDSNPACSRSYVPSVRTTVEASGISTNPLLRACAHPACSARSRGMCAAITSMEAVIAAWLWPLPQACPRCQSRQAPLKFVLRSLVVALKGHHENVRLTAVAS